MDKDWDQILETWMNEPGFVDKASVRILSERLFKYYRAEKEKSYQEGLEKSLEVLEGMKEKSVLDLTGEYKRNRLLSEAKEKIKELIDQK